MPNRPQIDDLLLIVRVCVYYICMCVIYYCESSFQLNIALWPFQFEYVYSFVWRVCISFENDIDKVFNNRLIDAFIRNKLPWMVFYVLLRKDEKNVDWRKSAFIDNIINWKLFNSTQALSNRKLFRRKFKFDDIQLIVVYYYWRDSSEWVFECRKTLNLDIVSLV